MSKTINVFSASVALSVCLTGVSVTDAWSQQSPAPITKPAAPVASPLQGGFEAALSTLRSNQWAEAVRLFTPLVNASTPEARGQARYGLAIAFSQQGEDAKALQTLDGTLRDDTPLGKAIGFLRARLLLQLADRYLAENGGSGVNPWLGQYERLADQPDSARYDRIKGAGQTSSGPNVSASPVLRVGVLLPLTGQLGDVGTSILRGVQLGLQDFDGRSGSRLELVVMDAGDAASAEQATEKLKGQGVDVVIGPLLAPAVTAVTADFAALNVPILALSNDRSVLGKGVNALNYLPGEQARLAARAAVSSGKRNLAVLAPSSAYGSEATEAFIDEAKRLGAKVTGSSFFDPTATDIGDSIRNIVGTQKGVVPFDTLFVPAPAASMALIRAQLNYYDVDKAGVMLLGTGLWQNNALLKPGIGMTGSMFAAPPKAFAFEDRYKAAFNSPANALAVVGYDTARILADVAGERQRTGQAVAALLQRPEGFYGSGGYFRFSGTGLSQRGLDWVRITPDNKFEVLAPALSLPPLPVPVDLQPTGSAGPWNWR